jgi:hypothetical protein
LSLDCFISTRLFCTSPYERAATSRALVESLRIVIEPSIERVLKGPELLIERSRDKLHPLIKALFETKHLLREL